MSESRETSRLAFASLLETALTGDGNPVSQVFGVKPTRLSGRGPYLLVLSAGTKRVRSGVGSNKWKNKFRVVIVTLVAESSTAENWNDDDVDHALDLVDKMIADVIASNAKNDGVWNYLTLDPDTFSVIAPTREFGAAYQSEMRYALMDVYE